VCNSLWISINSTHDCPCCMYTLHCEQKQSRVIYVLHTVQVTVHLSPLNKRSKQNASWNQQRVITWHQSTYTSIPYCIKVSFVVISSLSIVFVISQTLNNCPKIWTASKWIEAGWATTIQARDSILSHDICGWILLYLKLKQLTRVSNRVLILMLFTV
jgi:hypothetical protein